MRLVQKKLVELLDKDVSCHEPIYEFGSHQVAGQEGRSLRQLFVGRDYVGCDMRAGPGVDRIQDLHALQIPDESIGTIILLDTLEHVAHFDLAMNEIYRVLKPNGMVILSSVMYFPIHAHPDDYWRFTPSGFKRLSQKFPLSIIEGVGLKDFPHSVVSVSFKSPTDDRFIAARETILRWKSRQAQSWKEFLLPFVPPIMMVLIYRWFTRFLIWKSSFSMIRHDAKVEKQEL
jgi:SAM-dependent methyltransferase